jgi:hypothetical protein
MRLQLSEPAAPIKSRLRAAVCLLLATGVPAVARAEGSTQFDSSVLLYGERDRADVVEPTVRVTRTRANGQSFSVGLVYDVITGASPTGALPSGQVQTTTSASGTSTTVPAGAIPTTTFEDKRYALDGEVHLPLTSLLASTFAGHYSSEKDYSSLGASTKLSYDLDQRRITVTAGAAFDRDDVFPVGGTPLGLTDGTGATDSEPQPKHIASGLLGVARVVSRRWLLSLTGTRAREDGYLTEPYKVVSTVDATSGETVGQLTESRPDERTRNSVLAGSVTAIGADVLHVSYRYYWDDWSLESHTADLMYRHDLSDHSWIQPHLRWYAQNPASFYTTGLVAGAPLPAFASSDYRLGPLRTMTVGMSFGFSVAASAGEWTIRPEYIRQSLASSHGEEEQEDGPPEPGEDHMLGQSAAAASAPAVELPPLDILSLVVAYSRHF